MAERTSVRRLVGPIASTVLVVATAAAQAREASHLRPGERIYGQLAGGGSVTVLVDGVQGMSFSATARAFRGSKTALALKLESLDGTPIDVSSLEKIASGGRTARVAGFVFPATGAFRLTVTSTSAAAGGFDLDTAGVLPRKISGSAQNAAAATPLTFAAAAGDLVTCSVHASRGVKPAPTVLRFVGADGGVVNVNAPSTAKPLAVAAAGLSTFDVNAAGPFTYVLRFVRAKAPRTPLDAALIAAAGELSGTVVVEGLNDSDPTAESVATKSAARSAEGDLAAGEIVMSLPSARTRDEVARAAQASLPGARCDVKAALTDEGPYLVHVAHLVGRRDRRSKLVTRVLAKSASEDGRFAWCHPNWVVQADYQPNDPSWLLQYDLRQIRCTDAWDVTRGSSSVVVAVVDTGMTGHPDLAGAWLPGYDFITDPTSAGDGDGWDADPSDSWFISHGTHVAGTIGARTDDGIGMTGVAPFCSILPVRVLGRNGLGTVFDIAAGLRWAVGLSVTGAPTNPHPASVVNMSLGSGADSQVERDAVAAVMGQTNAIIVASAGNTGNSIPQFPASYSGVVSVSAVDSNLRLTSYSSYGDWVTIAAPGGDQSRGLHGIYSCYVDPITHVSGYRELDGTSMAAPHVAGVLALMISQYPTLPRLTITDALFSSALDLGPPGRDKYYGAGVVDARAALDALQAPSVAPVLFAGPAQLTFSDSQGRLSVLVGARNTTSLTTPTLNDVFTTTDQGSGWLTASTPATQLPAVVTVDVSPNLPFGAYTGHVIVDTSIGRQHVPVTVFRSPPPPVSSVVVQAVDSYGNVVARTTTGPALHWRWTLSDVPLGTYQVTSYADLDGTLAADRVDEFVGAWPLAGQPSFVDVAPDDLDHVGLVARLARYDERFQGIGVGGGTPAGALAVRAVDGATGADVSGAALHLLDGPPLAATDARGRALIVGGYNAAQTVTLVADGFVPLSIVGIDAQFLGFKMTPLAARPTRTLSATIHGLGAADVVAYAQFGDSESVVALDGSGTALASPTVVDAPGPVPVSVVAYAADGTPTRRAFGFVTPDDAGSLVVNVVPSTATAVSAVYAELPQGFPVAAAADLRVEAFVRGDDGRWMTLGGMQLAELSPTAFLWPPADLLPVRDTKIEVSAHDAAGRVFREIVRGTTDQPPTFHGLLAMRAPTALLAPADGSIGVDDAPTLQWTASPGARVHRVTVESLDGASRRILLVAGSVTSMRLPSPAGAALLPGTTYRWSVESCFGLGIDPNSHDDDDLETKTDGVSSSETATFTTK